MDEVSRTASTDWDSPLARFFGANRGLGELPPKGLLSFRRVTKKHLDDLIGFIADAIIVIDLRGQVLLANAAFERMYGWTQKEIIGYHLPVIPLEYEQVFIELLDMVLKGDSIVSHETEMVRKDGSRLDASVTISPILNSDDRVTAIAFMSRDITERKAVETELRSVKEQFESFIENSPDAIILMDLDCKIRHANESFERIYGRSVKEVIGQTFPFRDSSQPPDCYATIRDLRMGIKETSSFEEVHFKRDGSRVDVNVTIFPIRDSRNETIAFAGTSRDITDRKKAEEMLRFQAYHDPLSELPNRALFLDRLSLALAQARRNDEILAVLSVDLDRFKRLNDTLGHAIGDQLLQSIAKKLRACVHDGDTVARIGGDEFAALLPRIREVGDAVRVAEEIRGLFTQPWMIENHELFITTSIGIAIWPSDAEDPETLMKHAATAMYRAKERGRNGCQLFTQAMNAKVLERLSLETDLRHGIARQELVLHYQPQVDIVTGKLTGMEALVRWQHPERGLLSPGEFIPLAEDTGLIGPLDEWVLETACRQAKLWQDAGHAPLRMAVNLSAQQFQDPHLVDTVSRILQESGLDPKLLTLEITETMIMQNIHSARTMLRDLKGMGIEIALDDFGTGFSSLNYLKHFAVDKIKIDRSFMMDVADSKDDTSMVAVMVQLAQILKLRVIAEGVETLEQLTVLKDLRCDEAQGYLVSRPLAASDFEELFLNSSEVHQFE